MDYLNIFKDGSLPSIKQERHVSNLQILRCSYWEIQTWNHQNLSAPHWRLYWNQQAGASIYWENREFLLLPSSLILIAPNTPFRSRLGESSNFEPKSNVMVGAPLQDGHSEQYSDTVQQFFIHFSLGQPYDNIQPCIIDIEAESEILCLVSTLRQALSADRHHLNRQQSFSLHALILLAIKNIAEEAWPEPQNDTRILRVMSYIDEHLDRHLLNDDFGRIANMSTNAFTRLFREKTGETPLAYLNQRRLEKSSLLLLHTNQSIEEIADRCGFNDRYYFTRIFVKNFNIGPATYRAQQALFF